MYGIFFVSLQRKNEEKTIKTMAKLTIVRRYRNTETLGEVELTEVARRIRQQTYLPLCGEIRRHYPLAQAQQKLNEPAGWLSVWTKDLPKVCFSATFLNRNKRQVMTAYNGFVLLEVNNLGSITEAEAVRKSAGMIPQTMLAFVGTSGLSVKIVCRGELFDGGLPSSTEDIRRFHLNLYEKARMAYNMQLGVTIEKLEPELNRNCYMSCDADAVFNEMSQPFYTDCTDEAEIVRTLPARTERKATPLMPGIGTYQAQRIIYEYCLSKASDDVTGIGEEEGRTHLLLTRLAGYCQESGLPMAMAQNLALFNVRLGKEQELVRKIFENAYRQEDEQQYRRRKGIVRPLKNIPSETLLMMKVDMFLNSNYELRKNVMRGVAEYRERDGLGFRFQDLTEEARNSITMRALSQGVRCWDKDINRYVNSYDIERYEPMTDFLDHLPRWDGKDRVEELARRIRTNYEDWPRLFHIWMRSMVAMWRGKGQLTGNALVPVLIGRQGCGKTSFCRILLPREQRLYYNDRINFKNESDLNLGLAGFALINLDEFDKITQRQQIVLKYLVSTSDLKYRPPYGKAYSSHRRYASFIGTTNEQMPLTDPSGSRRFICVNVEEDIDFLTPIDYDQLYAQLEHEVSVQRQRYHLTRDEEHALMMHNLKYQRLSQLGEQLLMLFEKPEGTSQTNPTGGKWMTLKEISARLKEAHKSAYHEDEGTYIKIGNFLSRPEYKFERERRGTGMAYWVRER